MRKTLLMSALLGSAAVAAALDISLKQECDRAIARGMEYLGQQQQPDGSWRKHPGITGLVTLAFLQAPSGLTPDYEKRIAGGLKFILSNVKPDGTIYGGPPMDPYPNYSTAICLMALVAANRPEHTEVIRNARSYLLNSQFDETEGTSKDDPRYGGIGYGRSQRPDLSNTAFALEALHMSEQIKAIKASDTERKESQLHWEKALAFLARCQNLPSVNTNASLNPADAGGFYYAPNETRGGAVTNATGSVSFRSYGSMTYAGFKSLLYAKLGKGDKRTQAALGWIRTHWTFKENPGMGEQGHFYYLHAMAKALDAFGEATITDDKGIAHDWRKEMTEALLTMQRDGSFWVNKSGRWEESDPVLVTAYAVLALEAARGK
ncbi:MAG: prenyltransferase/squalene oxidase repeat-containing protein [Verrucomicrobiia bacterium]|jgi:squalene-hopene/tetraprenyl-beta-curcumene cyclase